jgi:tetratricopeptide (TPR) repeat protein
MPAEQIVAEGLASTPVNYHLLAAMGKIKAARKDYPAAISYYQKAIAIVPMIDSVVALGDLYSVTGNTRLADQQYSLVESIWKLNKANGVRGDIQIAQFYADHDRNLPEALRLAEEEVKTRKNVYVLDTLAWCYYKNGRYEDARRNIDLALSRQSPEALFLFHKGLIYGKCGNIQAARTALYQATSLNAYFHPLFAPMAMAAIQEYGAQTPPVRSASLPDTAH